MNNLLHISGQLYTILILSIILLQPCALLSIYQPQILALTNELLAQHQLYPILPLCTFFILFNFSFFYLSSYSSLSDLYAWDVSPLRSVRPDLSDVVSSTDGGINKTPRKTHYVHKANTIGIPSESDLHDGKNHHPRTRRNIFEGFRNTLRNKHKSDTVVLEAAAKENQEKNDITRRWSDNNHSTVNIDKAFT